MAWATLTEFVTLNINLSLNADNLGEVPTTGKPDLKS